MAAGGTLWSMKDAMPIDFHSHFPSPNAILCTAMPLEHGAQDCGMLDCNVQRCNASGCSAASLENLDGKVLMHFEGLLPQYWNDERLGTLKKVLARPSINLGEVGLDRRFESQRPLSKQFQDLVGILKYACELGRKVTIHSVHATEATIRAIEESSMPRGSVLWHGFSGSKETAAHLSKLGVLIGIGPRFHGDLCSIATANPAWVLETDYEGTDENQYNETLTAHYRSAAQRLGMTVEEVEGHCSGQAQAFANKPISW